MFLEIKILPNVTYFPIICDQLKLMAVKLYVQYSY